MILRSLQLNFKLIKTYFLLIITSCLLTACNVDYETMASQRVKYAQKNQGEIVIVALQDPNSHYTKGAMLAVEEINQQKGLLGRPLNYLLNRIVLIL